MKFYNKALMVGIVAVMLMSGANAFAGDPIRKLGRGISNVAFGALEIPMKMYDTNMSDGGLAAVTYGTLKGVCFFFAREVVGIVEVITFPIPLPECPDDPRDVGWGYGPLMTPEWVVDTDHNWHSIVYHDAPGMSSQ